MAEMNLHIHARDMECPGCFREGLEAGKAKSQWQPIETAPSGLPHILVTDIRGDLTNSGRVAVGWVGQGNKWISHRGSVTSPTHWMPLPPLPEAEHEVA